MARRAVGLGITSTIIGAEGFRSGGHVSDPVNGAGTAADVVAIAADSAAATATSALIATDAADIATSSAAITATAALLATDATDIGTTSDAAVEASIAVLEADGASPTQAHVNDLRALWNTMRTRVATFVTHSGTATTDASTLATRSGSLDTNSATATADAVLLATNSESLTADVAATPGTSDVVLSYDTTAVGNRSVLKRSVQLLELAAGSDFTT